MSEPKSPRRPPPPAPSPGNVIPFAPRTPARRAESIVQGWNLGAPAAPASRPSATARPARPVPEVPRHVPPVASRAPAAPAPAPAPRRITAGALAAAAMPMPMPMPAPAPLPPSPPDPTLVDPIPHAALPLAAPPLAAPPPANDVAPLSPQARWAVFYQLGLGPRPKEEVKQRTAKLIVNAYRLLGFAILTIIVMILVGYLATQAFYFVSDSWIQPMNVSKSDEKVVALESQVAQQENERDRILAELGHADRVIEVHQAFQAEFARAIRSDLSGRKVALDQVRALAKQYAGARDKIRKSNDAYASSSSKRMAAEYAAGLIDRGDMLSGKYTLAQITTSNLSLAERQVEFERRAAELEVEARALDAILSENGGDDALSYDVLKIKQDYEMSRLETAKALANREALRAALERQDAILEGLRQSPYLRAIASDATVAFVPYDNLEHARPGQPLYGCALEMVFCRKVGKVVEVLPGEVTFKHPHREKILRGQLVQIELSRKQAAAKDVLFMGGRPLLL